MTLTTESCVKFALAELQRAEAARQAEEARREELERQQAAERERIERERALEKDLHARRIAEVTARLQAEIELRELLTRERVTALRQALRELKAERDSLHERLRRRDLEPAASRPLTAGVQWAVVGFVLSVLVVVAAVLLMLYHTGQAGHGPVQAARWRSAPAVSLSEPRPAATSPAGRPQLPLPLPQRPPESGPAPAR
jgi:hypothetical protein